ncbi:MAG: carboxy-S-adenosyl-L-methionine synthase CmoA [Pseudomonadota bacterium]
MSKKSEQTTTDQIYREAQGKVGAFKFDNRVATVFADMISRSVPGYEQILSLLPTLARQFKFPRHNYYDLGCSLGAGLLAMAEGLRDTECNLIGVDSSAAMISQATPLIREYEAQQDNQIQLREEDILATELSNAGLVLLNFTLQFVPTEKRNELAENIYSALVPGGALVLSEKIKFSDARTDEALTSIHHQYKSDQGYTQLEISQKRDAIENVLIPETLASHDSRLRSAGFTVVTPWIQNLQFVSILAIK